jgi:chaperonin GroEL
VENIRQIQSVLEHVIKKNKPLLIIADVEPPVAATLAMNKQKGNIKINIISAPTFGVNKRETLDDLAMLTGATVINEDLGDDMDLIQPELLGTCLKAATTEKETVIQVGEPSEEILSIITQIKQELNDKPNPGHIIRLEKRLARLSAKIAIVKVGANSDIELKEKADRVEDAICATKAAIKEGIVSGGGIALLNAMQNIKAKNTSEQVLLNAVKSPFKVILDNAGIPYPDILPKIKGIGLNVVTGNSVDMIKAGIIDPLLVTKSALINAVSVATTILSTDCVINNLRQ